MSSLNYVIIELSTDFHEHNHSDIVTSIDVTTVDTLIKKN